MLVSGRVNPKKRLIDKMSPRFWGHFIKERKLLVGGLTHLKNISQIGNLPQIGVNIKNI